MKSLWTVLLIIAALLLCSWFVYYRISLYANELSAAVLEIYNKLEQDNTSALIDIAEMRRYWQSRETLLCCLLFHEDVYAISAQICRAEEWLRRGKSAEAAVELRELHHLLYYLPKSQGLNAEGIL